MVHCPFVSGLHAMHRIVDQGMHDTEGTGQARGGLCTMLLSLNARQSGTLGQFATLTPPRPPPTLLVVSYLVVKIQGKMMLFLNPLDAPPGKSSETAAGRAVSAQNCLSPPPLCPSTALSKHMSPSDRRFSGFF